jgi:SAM-dependent methyltransferase
MIGNLDGIDNDYIAGWAMDRDDPSRRIPVEVLYNGSLLSSTLAAFHRADLVKAGVGDGSNGFYVALPALDAPERAEVQVFAADTREPIGATRSITRRPKCSPKGILAAEMLRLQQMPLHSLSAVRFDGDHLVVTGIHLPPEGNPFKLKVHASPGTAFEVTYPVYNRNVGDWYWYWPNGSWSGYRIEIDLAASTGEGPHFEFTFETDDDDPAVGALGRNKVHVPKDLGVYQKFPHGDQLTRVQRFDSAQRVALAGYSHYRVVAQIAEHYGVDLANANILDWGCGHGRVIRHFAQQHAVKEAWGVDIDPENVGWLGDNFPEIQASHVPLSPPTDLPAEHFDFIYAISVMTHLTEEIQDVWLSELKRITKPGGIVALTFAGPSSVAFSSRFLTPDWLSRWMETGFDDTIESADLIDKIEDNSYYRNTKQTEEWTRNLWGKHFEVVDVHPCVFGYQDVAILRA